MRWIICVLTILVGQSFSMVSEASASLIAENSSYGLDTLTLDTGTGLKWLDVTLTQGLSMNQVLAQLGPGGQFEGFRYASTSELGTLIQNGGIASGNSSNNSDIAGVTNLISLLGQTFALTDSFGAILFGTRGFTGDHQIYGPPIDEESGLIFIRQNTDGSVTEIANPFAFTLFGLDTMDAGGGSFLIQSVPELSTWAMLLIGFATIAFLMRRRVTQSC